MDLEGIAIFLAVAEAGSIQAAAGNLDISRATVRRRLDDFELSVGVPLLQRSRAGAVVTSAGAVLAQQGRELMKHTQLLLTSIRDVEAKPQGTLRIALPIGLPLPAMVSVHHALLGMWPEMAFEFVYDANPRSTLPGAADVAMAIRRTETEYGYDALPQFTIPVRLLAAASYLDRVGRIEDPAELGRYDLLIWVPPGGDPTLVRRRDGAFLTVEPRVVSNHPYMLRAMAEHGDGVAFLPDPGFGRALHGGGPLERVLDDTVGYDMAVDLVVPTVLRDVPKVRRLVETVSRIVGLKA